MSDLRQQVLHALRWTFAARFLAQAITWCATLIVIRLLTPADYGLMAMAQTSAGLMFSLVSSGIADGLIQAKDLSGRVVGQVTGILIIMSGVLFFAQLLGAPLLSAFFDEPRITPVAQALALLFLTAPWIIISETVLTRSMEFRGKSLVDLGAAVCSSALSLILAMLGAGVWSLVAALLSVFAIRAIGLSIICPLPHRPVFRFDGIGEQLRFGTSAALIGIIFSVYVYADLIIGGYFLGAAELGIYATTLHFATMPLYKVMPLIHQVAFPAYSSLRGHEERLRQNFLVSIRLTAVVVFPLFFGMATVAPELVAAIFGDQWSKMVGPMMVLTIGMPFRALTYLYKPLFKAIGRPGLAVELGVITLVSLLIAFTVGVHFGTMGLACSWLLVFPPVLVLTTLRACRELGFSPALVFREIWPPALAATLMLVMNRGAAAFMEPNGVPTWLILTSLVFTGIAVYALTVWYGPGAFRERIAEDLRLLRGPAAES